jgi:D-glycero-alpha-D-manno-heptose-7-phosphate kinase
MLITVKAPLRISFFGGGTDYPEYFMRSNGSVIGMAIDKYIYISALRLTNILDFKYRVAYSKTEFVNNLSDIEHPVVRHALNMYKVNYPFDISVTSDLPARSGLGSSSSFTVGILTLLDHITGLKRTRYDTAINATYFERNILAENVGYQDQFHSAFGGLNRFDFDANGVKVAPVQMTSGCQQELISSLFLVFTGVTRYASRIVLDQVKHTADKLLDVKLAELKSLVDDCVKILQRKSPEHLVRDFGRLLHESWILKQTLSKGISSDLINSIYSLGLNCGATGGKLCGAGGGGFILFVVPNENSDFFKRKMADYKLIRIGIDVHGATVLNHASCNGNSIDDPFGT